MPRAGQSERTLWLHPQPCVISKRQGQLMMADSDLLPVQEGGRETEGSPDTALKARLKEMLINSVKG